MKADDPGFGAALRRLGATVLTLVNHRLELASVELSDAGAGLIERLVAAFVVVLLFGGAVVALSAWCAVALWPTLGHSVLVWLALVYAAAGGAVVWWLRSRARTDPPLLAASLAALRTDAELLGGQAAAPRPDPAP
jgi:uncharacterized membrane protein YqjE